METIRGDTGNTWDEYVPGWVAGSGCEKAVKTEMNCHQLSSQASLFPEALSVNTMIFISFSDIIIILYHSYHERNLETRILAAIPRHPSVETPGSPNRQPWGIGLPSSFFLENRHCPGLRSPKGPRRRLCFTDLQPCALPSAILPPPPDQCLDTAS